MEKTPALAIAQVAKKAVSAIIAEQLKKKVRKGGGRIKMFDELTENDIKKMEEEITYRKVVLRKELLEHVKEARAHGDLSENFEYHAAKKEKNRNESRIRYLEKMIKTATIIEDDSDESQIGLNDSVTIYIEEDDMEECFKIVTTIRSDAINNMVSIESPIGEALLKHKVGDRVYIKINDSDGYYAVIRKIEKRDDESEKISSY